MDYSVLHINIGWLGMLGGAISGALIGLFFHNDNWVGGYGSFRRRMLRLGHIAFFGIGFLNLMFALTLHLIELGPIHTKVASTGFAIAMVAMPLCCFLTAWRKSMRHLFPVPVLSVLAGVMPILMGA